MSDERCFPLIIILSWPYCFYLFYVYLRCIQSLHHHNIYSIFWSGQMSADGFIFTEASFSSLLLSLVREEQESFAVIQYLHAKVTLCGGVRGCVSVCVRWTSEFFPNWPLLGMFLMLKQKQVWLRMRCRVTVNLPTSRTWSYRFKGWFRFPQNNCRPCNMGHKKSEIINTWKQCILKHVIKTAFGVNQMKTCPGQTSHNRDSKETFFKDSHSIL